MRLSDAEIKKVCKDDPECYCPPMHEVRIRIANTPEYLRRYFMLLGMRITERSLNVVTGKDAERFRKETGLG